MAFVAAQQLSIAGAQILLTLLLAAWAVSLVKSHRRPEVPPFFLPLAAYASVTLVVSLFSVDPMGSFGRDKQLILFAVVPVVYHLARRARALTILDVIVSVGAASAAFGIVQFGILHYDNLGQRPHGTLGHYMTYSGMLMLVICAAAARLVFGKTNRMWSALVMPALLVALQLTFGRSAWVGVSVAVGLLFLLKDFRLLGLIPVVIALTFAFAPDSVVDRMVSIFDRKDPTSRDRVAMLEIGQAMVKDHPLTGVGPNMVPRVYAKYRTADAVNQTNPHLHNVPMHIAAERGLPALAVWVWFIVSLTLGLVKLLKRPDTQMLAAGGLAAVAGMLAAGFFEYNFGDSEFLMHFLVLVTLPFAAARPEAEASPAR